MKGCGAGSPPSTTSESASSTAQPRIIFFLLGGVEALMMRLQLARPSQDIVSPEVFSQLFTMHGLTMIFLAIMPLTAAFFNFMIPLMIGARDVAFPRLNALSYWIFLGGGILLNSGWFLKGSPNCGWFAYANCTESYLQPGPRHRLLHGRPAGSWAPHL